jgi:hypothetical protein
MEAIFNSHQWLWLTGNQAIKKDLLSCLTSIREAVRKRKKDGKETTLSGDRYLHLSM